MKYNKLLLTFFEYEYRDTLKIQIADTYDILNSILFEFELEDSTDRIFTYRVITPLRSILKNTIMIHRRIETNTFYTLNALNRIVKDSNEGMYDKNYQINWSDYPNTLIMLREDNITMRKMRFLNQVKV